MELMELIIVGAIVYLISVLIKYTIKIVWAVTNWIADKYITDVLKAEVDGEPMVDYFPAKELFAIRRVVKKNVR